MATSTAQEPAAIYRWTRCRQACEYLTLALILGALYLWIPESTTPERDGYRFLLGVQHLLSQASSKSQTLIYGFQLSPIYYLVNVTFAPLMEALGVPILRGMHLLNFCAVIALFVLMFLLAKRLFGNPFAFAVALVPFLLPVAFVGFTYSHPMNFAVTFMVAALIAFDVHISRRVTLTVGERSAGSWPIATIWLLTIGTLFRADILLVAPALLAIAFHRGIPIDRCLVLVGRIVAVSAFAFFVGRSLIAAQLGIQPEGASSFIGLLSQYHDPRMAFANPLMGPAQLARAVGPFLPLFILAALMTSGDRLRTNVSATLILAAIGCAIFWLPNPSPPRHFLYLVVPISLLVGAAIPWCWRNYRSSNATRYGLIATAVASVAASLLSDQVMLASFLVSLAGFAGLGLIAAYSQRMASESSTGHAGAIWVIATALMIGIGLAPTNKHLLMHSHSVDDAYELDTPVAKWLEGEIPDHAANASTLLVVADGLPLITRLLMDVSPELSVARHRGPHFAYVLSQASGKRQILVLPRAFDRDQTRSSLERLPELLSTPPPYVLVASQYLPAYETILRETGYSSSGPNLFMKRTHH